MLIPKKNRVAIYEHLFCDGVMVAKKDFNAPKHPDVPSVPNLQVIKALQVSNATRFPQKRPSSEILLVPTLARLRNREVRLETLLLVPYERRHSIPTRFPSSPTRNRSIDSQTSSETRSGPRSSFRRSRRKIRRSTSNGIGSRWRRRSRFVSKRRGSWRRRKERRSRTRI